MDRAPKAHPSMVKYCNMSICVYTETTAYICTYIYIYNNNCTNISTYVTYIMLSIFTYTCIYIYIYIYIHILLLGVNAYIVLMDLESRLRNSGRCQPVEILQRWRLLQRLGRAGIGSFSWGKPSSGSESLSDLRITSGKLTVCKLENGHLVRWFTH